MDKGAGCDNIRQFFLVTNLNQPVRKVEVNPSEKWNSKEGENKEEEVPRVRGHLKKNKEESVPIQRLDMDTTSLLVK